MVVSTLNSSILNSNPSKLVLWAMDSLRMVSIYDFASIYVLAGRRLSLYTYSSASALAFEKSMFDTSLVVSLEEYILLKTSWNISPGMVPVILYTSLPFI